MTDVIFAILCIMTIGCGLFVVFSRNPVYSAFSLVLCFFGLSTVYVMWGATFIAMIQILVYTGAIVVLFVFVVMLLDQMRVTAPPSAGWWTIGLSGAAVWCLSLLLLRTLNRSDLFRQAEASHNLVELRSVAKLLFTQYLWPFEVLSIFLLALIIAVYLLTRPESPSDSGRMQSGGKS